ncbi:MAG: hypothetical protein QGG87_03265 [Nitrospinota bacterium]|nr:hypothetical protein [Nitrospinota bacterium]
MTGLYHKAAGPLQKGLPPGALTKSSSMSFTFSVDGLSFIIA